MHGVLVDPVTKTAIVEAGCLLRDLDHAAGAFGLAVPAGTVSHTGLAGLTLGGGYGWLARSYGATIDSLIKADVVLADGSFVTASETSHEDLFWALRGAGTNFGIVTAFTFRLHPVDHVLSFQLMYPFDQAESVLKAWFELEPSVPNELSVNAHFVSMPNEDKFVSLSGCYNGPEEAGRAVIAPILALGTPSVQKVSYIPYRQHQRGGDDLAPHGRHFYIKAGTLNVTADIITRAVRHYQNAPNVRGMLAILGFSHVGGAINNVSPTATAFSQRFGSITMELITSWTPTQSSEDVELMRAWCRNTYKYFQSEFQGVYNNFAEAFDGHTHDELTQMAYGVNIQRLKQIKSRYDPSNFFQGNLNIAPAASN